MTGTPARPRSVVIHAHFYQPPREEPSLELVEREPNAAPWHDWNQRIERDCYRTVVAARLMAPDGGILNVVNTLEQISFNVGPTLAAWLERETPDTWRAMLEADRSSATRLGGHGNAMAMPYHHLILPLATRRDKETEVRWGIADFRRCYGREPEGMWLPETAVDDETLDVLAAEGIRFTVLAPHQVEGAPAGGGPGRYTTANGRSIALFAYDGPLSHGVAFGPLISDAKAWAAQMLDCESPAADAMLVSIATDGETYGHHHAFGEMALASVLARIAADPDARIENFGSYLARHPATHPVGLLGPSSWSCSHGVERWRANCGCRTAAGTSQAWRAPLRQALDQLAVGLHRIFAAESAPLLTDPWRARDAYTTVGLPSHLPVRARELLEMERNALRMFTSCGWFFDDIGGLESLVCLRYAARAIDLAGPSAAELEVAFRERLSAAVSNDPEVGTGQDIYDRAARPSHPGGIRAAAGFAALRALVPDRVRSVIGAYLVGPDGEGRVLVRHRRTGVSESFDTSLGRPDRLGVVVAVRREAAAAPAEVKLAELPEYERTEIEQLFRRELCAGLLTEPERAEIVLGTSAYPRSIADALTRLLPPEPTAADTVDPEQLERALDLLALERIEVPFDAQTRFHRALTRGSAELRRELAPLAVRFGFSPSAGAPPAP